MRSEEFSGWLSAIASLSAVQRGAALEALKSGAIGNGPYQQLTL